MDNSQINAVEISIPDRDRSRISIQILDQALPLSQAQAHQDPIIHSYDGPHGHQTQAQELHQAEALLDSDHKIHQYESAFDKIQNLQWYSEHFKNNSPYELFKQIIRNEGFGHKELLMIGEALLVFGQDDADKSRVETYLSTLDELETYKEIVQ